MTHDTLRRTFVVFHLTLGLVLFIESLRTALSAARGGPGHANVALAIFASTEALAALLFLLPRLTRAAGVTLLIIFAVAFLLHLHRGELHLTLLVYGAGVALVMAHGSALGDSQRLAGRDA
jgi:uncharacterized membrane protein YphA (DoxX/SURF4 family)